MKNNFHCVLFDMDGVILDTERIYSNFWVKMGQKYNTSEPDIYTAVTGLSDAVIIQSFFSHLNKDELNALEKDISVFESGMPFPEMQGALSFIEQIRALGLKTGLVTSSENSKLENIEKELHLSELFDTMVTADHVSNKKPHPEPYLTAADWLNIKPENCLVFEDSLVGIESAQKANMTVVGFASTLSQEILSDKCSFVISDYNMPIKELISKIYTK
jgi:HAD superfamily hydrolase (TIGR01509 family)